MGVLEDDSKHCGASDGSDLHCYGKGMGEKFVLTWNTYILDKTQDLLDKNISVELIDCAANCCRPILSSKDVIDTRVPYSGIPKPDFFNWGSNVNTNGAFINVLIPKSFY